MNLVLVESPAKAKTIEKYLGNEYKVMATIGHMIDLPKSTLAVDVENNYAPQFEVIKGKGALIKKIKKEVPKDGKVFLAMDPDREGEAIAFHTASALKLKKALRISFNEITHDVVVEAIKHPRDIDQALVDAQFARRILDRLVGYKLSELLWKKIWYGLSAGRVQSVALRLVVEREEEIEAFVPSEFWDVSANLQNRNSKFVAKLSKIDGKKETIKNEGEANEIKEDIGKNDFKVVEVSKKEINKHAYPPLTTSKLQQSANILYGYSAKRTMGIAQSLYQAGFITYMRTDSTNLSSQSIAEIRKYVAEVFGKEYLPAKENFYKTKVKNAQEAHEAIRPTSVFLTQKEILGKVSADETKLYGLIWRRAVASQMESKKVMQISAQLSPKNTKKEYIFSVSGEKILFDGFRKVFNDEILDENIAIIEDLNKGDNCKLIELLLAQKYTKPKPRYNEASLVKTLEKLGIGRPSTYATIISTVIDRGYVEKKEKQLFPTEVGRVVCHFLKKNFMRLVDYEYTAGVEEQLDDIVEGKVKYVPFIDSQYKPLIAEIAKTNKEVSKEDVVVLGKSDEKCPLCGGEMIVKLGKNGKFLSCAKFPECKGIISLNPAEVFDENKFLKAEKCDKCGKEMVLKSSKYGQFWSCIDYPTCKNAKPLLLKDVCPECGKNLVEKKGRWGKTFIGCSGYPDCKYIKKTPKKEKKEE